MKGLALVLVLVAASCAAPAPGPSPAGAPPRQDSGPVDSRGAKTLTIGVTTAVQAMGVMGSSTTLGGWGSMSELHSDSLVTTDTHSRRLVGRLAERAPSIDDGTMAVLPDGRMRVVYPLRKGVTWQDGAPFTARDLVFTTTFLRDPGIPAQLTEGVGFIDTAEAADDHSFVLHYRAPYYLGGSLGVRQFWPQPLHLLGDAYGRYLGNKNPDEVAHLPYWTSDYVHLGPFRLVSFDPGEGTSYRGYDGYFLGRPRIDVVHVRTYSDQNALFANLLAGTVDLVADTALNTELGYQLKNQWDASGAGTIHVRPGGTRFLSPQMRPSVQMEPANLDPRVRSALYRAIDREALSEGLPYKEQPAWGLLPPGDRLYDATKDGLRGHAYDPDRARAILREVGWAPGPDGVLRHGSDGRRFRNAISTTAGSRHWEMAVFADFWRRIGLEVEEITISASQVRNLELRAHYPGWEPSSSGAGDSLLGRLEGPAASAENRWTGNRGGYDDPRATQLVTRYYTSLSERDQFQAMQAVADFVAAELPLLLTYYNTDHIGARRGVKALDDVAGGYQAGQPYGTYTRNAYLWDLE